MPSLPCESRLGELLEGVSIETCALQEKTTLTEGVGKCIVRVLRVMQVHPLLHSFASSWRGATMAAKQRGNQCTSVTATSKRPVTICSSCSGLLLLLLHRINCINPLIDTVSLL